MTNLIERARKFRRFDGDCTCPSLINELANRVEFLEGELSTAAEAHCEAEGSSTKRRGDDAIKIAALERRVHDLTSALRHVQTELNIAVGSFGNARRAADIALDGKAGD